MDAKRYLRKIRRLDELIDAKVEQVEILKTMATKVTVDNSEEKVQKSCSEDQLSSCVAKIVDLEEEINRDIDKLVDLKREVMRKIDKLENKDYKLLLTLRYLNLKTWEEIAVEMKFTFQWVHKLHKRSLDEFEKLITVDSN